MEGDLPPEPTLFYTSSLTQAMAFACNVNRKGRLVRASWGIMSLILGLLVLTRGSGSPASLLVAVLLFGGAAWGIVLGGIRGWCAARALGIKTPI